MRKLINILAAVIMLVVPGAQVHASDDTSLTLPPGFTPMKGNSPPSREAYSLDLPGQGHVLVVSVDRRALPKAFEFIEEKGEFMAGPLAAGVIAGELEAIKADLGKPRPGWRTEISVEAGLAGALAHDLCEAFSWDASFFPTEATPEREPWSMHGMTMTCFFLGSESAWLSSGTVSENVFPGKGQILSEGFASSAREILSSLRY